MKSLGRIDYVRIHWHLLFSNSKSNKVFKKHATYGDLRDQLFQLAISIDIGWLV